MPYSPETSSTIHESPEGGLCQCGCGLPTNLAPRTSQTRGWTKGLAVRYRRGHNRRKTGPRYAETPTGFKTDCWLWLLSKDKAGYGWVRTARAMSRAHRVYYEARRGNLPEGLVLDHLCRVPACVNPDHLEVVTQATNVQRGKRAKLTTGQVADIRSSSDAQNVIARRFGISQSHVSRIRSRGTWRTDDDHGGNITPHGRVLNAA